MALASTYIDAAGRGMVLTELRNQHKLLDILAGSNASNEVRRLAIAGGTNGCMAKAVDLTLLTSAANPVEPLETIASLPSSANTVEDVDLTVSGYLRATTSPIQLKIDNFAWATKKVNDIQAYFNAVGQPVLQSEVVRAMVQGIGDKRETAIVADIISHGQFASESGGTGTGFALDLGSETDMRKSFAILAGAADKNNWGPNRLMVLSSTGMASLMQFSSFVNQNDYRVPNDLTSGKAYKFMGFNFVESNLIASDAVFGALDIDKYVYVENDGAEGMHIEALRDIHSFATYLRMWSVAGFGPLGGTILAFDGGTPSPNNQTEGIIAGSVAYT